MKLSELEVDMINYALDGIRLLLVLLFSPIVIPLVALGFLYSIMKYSYETI